MWHVKVIGENLLGNCANVEGDARLSLREGIYYSVSQHTKSLGSDEHDVSIIDSRTPRDVRPLV